MYAFLYIFMYSIFQKGSKSFSSYHIQNKKEALNKTSFRARDGTRTLRHLVNPYKIKEKNTLSSRCLQFLYDIYI